MAITINGSGTIGGISTGGLNDNIITKNEMATAGAWAPTGTVLQVVQGKLSSTYTTTFSGTGFAVITPLYVTITPQSASSKVLVMLNLCISNVAYQLQCQILRNGSVVTAFNGDAEGGRQPVSSRWNVNGGYLTYAQAILTGQWLDSPASTSALTYTVQARNYSAYPTIYVNRAETFQNAGLDYDGVPQSTITVMEIAG